MLTELPISKFLDISTKHITKEDNEILEQACIDERNHDETGEQIESLPVAVISTQYGFMIWVPTGKEWTDEDKAELKQRGISQALINLIDQCNQQQIRLICLDRDGPDIDGLPEFDW